MAWILQNEKFYKILVNGFGGAVMVLVKVSAQGRARHGVALGGLRM